MRRYSLKICSRVKFALIVVLAFFIAGFLTDPSFAQEEKTLENGLRVIVKEDHRNGIVVFSAFIDVGSASEGRYLGSGISHLIEHMLFKGTKKYPHGEIEDILHKYGGNIEGFTSYDYTGFRLTILKDNTDIAIDILKDMFTEPLFNSKELNKEMQVIEREMDLGKDDPVRMISRLTFSNAYIRHPYKVPIIGYKQNFRRLKRNDLLEFFKERYTPENIVIAIVGDIDKDSIVKDMEDVFGMIPRGHNRIGPVYEEPKQIVDRYVEERMDIDGAYLNIAFHSTDILDRDTYALDILSFILAGGDASILNEKIRMKEKLVLSISAYNYTPKEEGLFIVASILKEEDIKSAVDAILKEIETVKLNGVTKEELTRAKNNFLSGYIYEKERISAVANDLALGELLTGNPDFFRRYIDRIKVVTLEDIKRVANLYLTKENMTVITLTKSGRGLDLGSHSKEGIEKNKRKINKVSISNNLPLIVSEDPSLPLVAISLIIKGGLRIETEENNGISKLVSLMLMDGTDAMTRKEIAISYEFEGMSVNTYSANNSLGISVKCLKEYTEDAFKLIASLCKDSTFPEDEFEREKKELSSLIDIQDDQIFRHGQRLLKRLIFNTHPYRFQVIGTHKSIDKIKRKDVLRFYRTILSPDNMVLGISGDCDMAEIKRLAERYFSDIPLRKEKPSFPEKELPMNTVREFVQDIDKEQSLVLVAFNGIDVYSKDRYAVEVMMDVLSRESGILFKKIRGKKGLSYATGAFQVTGIDAGYIVIYVLTSRNNITKVKDAIFKEIAGFVRDGISEEELEISKAHLKAMRQIEMETNEDFIFTVTIDELYGLGYNNYKGYNKRIDGITRQDIKRVTGDILTLDRCAIVVLEGK